VNRLARQIRIAATIKLLEWEAISAAKDMPLVPLPDDRGADTKGLAIGSPLPSEHQRLRAMLLGMMGGKAGGPSA
jgi:hypothetical protein